MGFTSSTGSARADVGLGIITGDDPGWASILKLFFFFFLQPYRAVVEGRLAFQQNVLVDDVVVVVVVVAYTNLGILESCLNKEQ